MAPSHDDQETVIRAPGELPPSGHSRFTPGTILANRFRIVALLGRGGMGEVYRAEDVKLGQQVALKFLPAELAADTEKLRRLYGEVRLGRQVSHPNVCRLYDLTDFEGHYFISMEYIDGEDLASLLRRIGKLPADKALDITRDLCAGVAAAHSLGVIHRDLKPANVMIDGRGTARITDFGLAALADDAVRLREMSGTPAYMAPEQLHGEPITERTDLYALGLILYEMFTGKRLFQARTVGEIKAQHQTPRSQSLATDTRDLDPAVQRIIVRCLEEKPEDRPASIHSVIAALPGGDPLQAAIEAGETPSPEMVAAAGATGELRPSIAWALLIGSILVVLLVARLAEKTSLYGKVSLPTKPDVLVERARNLLAMTGYRSASRDSVHGFYWNNEFFEHGPREKGDTWSRLNEVRPSPVAFWYRESPREMVAQGTERRVTPQDPPLIATGGGIVEMDAEGRLNRFAVQPPAVEDPPGDAPSVDWNVFIREAGLEVTSMREVSSRWSIPVDTDRRFAWETRYASQPEVPMHVVAGSYHGRPVWFAVTPPWQRTFAAAPRKNRLVRIAEIAVSIGSATALITAIFLARRNMRRARGDRRGAFRVGMFMFWVAFLARIFRIDHSLTVRGEWTMLVQLLGEALLFGGLVGVLYLALEPLVRRRWPHMLISWNRVVSGKLRDPLVGRHLLIGIFAGAVIALMTRLMILAPTWFAMPALTPIRAYFTVLTHIKHLGFMTLSAVRDAVSAPFMLLFLLFLLQAFFRKRWIALAILICVLALTAPYLSGENLAIELSFSLVLTALVVFTLLRFGVLAMSAVWFTGQMLGAAPITLNTSVWYFDRSLLVLMLMIGLAIYAFWVSLANQPLFSMQLLEEE